MRLSKNGSLHERSRNARCSALIGAVDGPDRGERSEIVARPRARAAVLKICGAQ